MRYDDPRWYEQSEKHDQQALPPVAHSDESADPSQVPPTATEDAQVLVVPTVNNRRGRHIFAQVVITLAFMTLAFLGGWFAHQAYTANTLSSPSQKYLSLFEQAWQTVDQNYVDRKAVNYKQMSYDAIQAMLSELGDTGHTRFLTAQDVQSEQQQLSGSYAGIGVYVQQDPKTKNIAILSTIAGAPAAQAGLKAGDILTKVNGKSVAGLDFTTQVQPLIEGQAGTQVTITIKRPSNGQTITFTVKREQIQVPNVLIHYIPQDHIAQIQIVQFSNGVSDQLKTAILQAKKDGATKLILDLRNNPGGYLQQAINTASEFMAKGTVLIEQDSSGHQTKSEVTGETVDTGIPMVVLVNKNTASAAEIVAGSLQDNGRAVIMGTTTYGTGTVLQEFDLSDGSAILLGVDEWLTPKGKFIRGNGISPSAGLTVNMDATNVLTPDVEDQNNMTLAQIMGSKDVQLIAAINYLQTH